MAIKIQSTADIQFVGVKCIIFGGAGVGKTRAIATAPSPIIISAEQGLLSLMEVDVPYIEVNSLEELDRLTIYLKRTMGRRIKPLVLIRFQRLRKCLLRKNCRSIRMAVRLTLRWHRR